MLRAIKDFFEQRRLTRRNNAIRAAYHSGKPLARMIARDVRREFLVVGIDELESGFIVVQQRTQNLLGRSKSKGPGKVFGKPERIAIESMWKVT